MFFIKKTVQVLSVLILLTLTARKVSAGSIVRLFYDGISTSSSLGSVRTEVATLTNASRFPDDPSYREQFDDFVALPGSPLRAGFQSKDNSGVDFGSWIRGYLEAPETGDYIFGIASDDNSQLYLSEDHTEENRRLIAAETGSGSTLFGGARLAERTSEPVRLVRGHKYYVEVLHKQGGGGSYVQVGWQRPDGTQEIIPALHLAQHPIDLFRGSDLTGFPPTFNANGLNAGDLPANVSVAEGSELLLQLDVVAPQPTTFIWKRDTAVIPSEDLSFLRIKRTPATWNGAKVSASVTNEFGELITSVTTIKVTPDVIAPSVIAVNTGGNPNTLQVAFSEPVSAQTATNPANYEVRITGGAILPISTVTLQPGGQTVHLTGAFSFQEGVNYQITVRDIKDLAAAPNGFAVNPYVSGFAFTAPQGTTIDFNNGRPSGFLFFGLSDVVSSGSYDGSGYLKLTDGIRNQNSAVLFTERHNVDQVRIRFKARISDGGSTTGVDDPGDGFSVNIASDLPLGNLPTAEEGFTPDVPGSRLSFTFDTHRDSSVDDPGIGVLYNNTLVTNLISGTAGVPTINNPEGRWVDVDIDLRRSGQLTITYDGVKVIDRLPTPFEIINNAQIGFAARTRTWYQTHWFDDININFGEGDIGSVGISAESELGDRSFTEGSEARLAVLPTGAGPFAYQWFKNGTSVAGQTNRALKFAADLGTGGTFKVNVRNDFSQIDSQDSHVTIVPDSEPPQVVSTHGVAGGVNQLQIVFNELLDPATASDPATYSSPLLKVGSARLNADGRSVTLQTTPQRVGISYPLTITGLKDLSTAANALTITIQFSSSLEYRDEVLADQPSRYYRFEETSGTVALTETVLSDRLNTNATYLNLPVLGVPGLVPSETNSHAVQFVAAQTNYIVTPNGGDVNDFRGPWPQKSFELWFKANATPPPGSTGLAAAHTLYEEGGNQRGIQLYLWRNPTNSDPAQAEIIFHAYNSSADGPGAPFGVLTQGPIYVHYPIVTNTTYHVIAVFDGRTDGFDGELRLYINGQLVGRAGGIGQIYNHNGDIRLAYGNVRTHDNVSGVTEKFDGVIDDLSLYNSVLSEDRILAHYHAGTGESISSDSAPTTVVRVNPAGNPNKVLVTFNQPVSQTTAVALANYDLSTAVGAPISINSATLLDDLVTVRLDGSFGFVPAAGYKLTVHDVADILDGGNSVASTNIAFTFASAGPVGVGAGSDLADKVATENDRVAFAVVPTGEAPFTYQWRFNGSPIAGQTNAILRFNATLGSTGNYSVSLSNEFSGGLSSAAHLTVNADSVSPALAGVRGLAGTLNEVRILLSEPADPITGARVGTYQIPGLSIQNATVSADGRLVTLKTSSQVSGQSYTLAVSGLKDRAASPNILTTTAPFTSIINYRDEIIGDGAARYFPLDEVGTSQFTTLVSIFDTTPAALIGTITNGPVLGVPGLISNLPNSTAIGFSGSTSNRLDIPNGRDLNAILGPWPKRTYLFTFAAGSLPRIDGTNVASPTLWAEGRAAFYLYGTQDTNNPSEALLVFTAHNNASEGPGTPWGALTGNPATAKFVSVPVQAGKTYNVVGVLNGDGTGAFNGRLELYVNGAQVGFTTGVGQLYRHPNNYPSIGHGAYLRHDGVAQTLANNQAFDGVIDEFAILNRALSASRIAQLNTFSLTPPAGVSLAPHFTSISLESGNLSVTWEGAGRLHRAEKVEGPYLPVEGATSPYSAAVNGNQTGFLLIAP